MSLPPRRTLRAAQRKKTRRLQPRRLLLVLGVALALAIGIGGGVALGNLLSGLPSIDGLGEYAGQNSILYDVNGHPIGTLPGAQDRTVVSLNKIPKILQEAVIATEDARFYQNQGFDLKGIIRAAFADLRGRSYAQGASTISEQLAKILFLSDQKSLTRKIKQVILAIELERRYTKSEILDAYLNQVYLGQGAYGVEAAARVYFDEPVEKLDLAQAALIAGLPQLPTGYDPYIHPRAALARRREVLQRMVEQGYITPAEAARANAEPLNLKNGSLDTTSPEEIAPFFVDAVYQNLVKQLGPRVLAKGNLRIYTTLDPRIQIDVDRAVSAVLDPSYPVKDPTNPRPQAAAVVMNPKNGYVLALYGGRAHPMQFPLNWAYARRYTGSSIKPIAEYAAAIESGYTQMSVFNDAPWRTYKGKLWPQNDDHTYRGRITLRKAIAISDNNVAVRLATVVGLRKSFEVASRQFGLPLNPRNAVPSWAIGAVKASVMDMTDAYATFPNQGLRPDPILVTRVLDAQGNVLLSNTPRFHQVMTPAQAYVMTKMLEGVIQRGTGYQVADIGRPAAGKTGTSEDFRDGWFIGYTPDLVAGVWEGNTDETTQGHDIWGATFAAPIWQRIMTAALQGKPIQHFPRPKGLVYVRVDNESGLLPSPLTPADHIRGAWFVDGTQPTDVSDAWETVKVDANDPTKLYNPADPASVPLDRVFLRPPSGSLDGPMGMLTGPDIPLPQDSALWPPVQLYQGSPPAPATSSPTAPPPPESVSLQIKDGLISPTTLNATAGSTLNLTVDNQDGQPYTFELPGFKVSQSVPAGSSVSITVTLAAPGSFAYDLAGQPGATGELNVNQPPAASSQGSG